ncbi:phosphotransferase family protein [Nocardioides zeae]|uniref:Phosphotransferase family protein n=1 Tax=Nocardioides zeae TaxID=1457234 RepID=A0A6P0HLM6_9ACTN|nr:phosphotransferase family protein [Nocardioides zeae]NEN79157.1 phosphotransferase family protein [Nocardioides zeae]
MYDEKLDRPDERVEVAPVRAGEELDWDALERYLRATVTDADGAFEVLQFPNGSANLTYRVALGEQMLVVRRPPFGQVAPKAHDMEREHRVLAGLHPVYPRAPRAVAFCGDTSVIGAPFLVSEYRRGVVVWDRVPDTMPADAGHQLGIAAVEALADLHAVDPAAAGLERLGRPEGYLERQVGGWTQRWQAVTTYDGPTATDAVADELASTLPVQGPAAVVHNDFKLDNCQFAPDDPTRVTSVFDWDMATLGDPLTDLGTLLNYWPDPAVVSILPGVDELGLPSKEEVVAAYGARLGRDLSGGDLAWYEAFGYWKTAVILQQLYARFVRGETSDPRMAGRGAHVTALSEHALHLLKTI